MKWIARLFGIRMVMAIKMRVELAYASFKSAHAHNITTAICMGLTAWLEEKHRGLLVKFNVESQAVRNLKEYIDEHRLKGT